MRKLEDDILERLGRYLLRRKGVKEEVDLIIKNISKINHNF